MNNEPKCRFFASIFVLNYFIVFYSLKTKIGTQRQRDKLIEKVAVCQRKMGWLKFEELFVKFEEQKADLKKAMENQQIREDEMKPFVERLREITDGKTKLERRSQETRAEYEKQLERLVEINELSRRLKESETKAKADYEVSDFFFLHCFA